jgi:putative holliday junction resolvase
MRYLGIDWGLKNIGLAISEGEIASPLKTIQVNNFEEAILKVSGVMEDEIIDLIILGNPEGSMGKIAKKVANRLKSEGFEVIMVDETLSTKNSKIMMIEMGLGRKKRRDDNSVAAAIILQRYLDENK